MAHSAQAASLHGHHVLPKKTLLTVFLTLVGLTVLTVAVAMIDLGSANVPIALAIAGVKAALVVMFFMALKYDRPVNTLVFSVGAIFVFVFMTFTLFDTAFRGDLTNVNPETIQDIERREEALKRQQPQLFGQESGGVNAQQAAVTDSAAADTMAATRSDSANVLNPREAAGADGTTR